MDVSLDPAALEDLLNSPEGPVGVIIGELSEEATKIARAAAPVLQRRNWSRWGSVFDPRYQYGPAAFTKGDVRVHFPAFNKFGQIYGGVNAPSGPTLFLERPARTMHSLHPFLTTAVETVSL